MEIHTRMKPNFATMTTAEVRAYLLAHRDDQEALQAYIDKTDAENPNPRYYGPDDSISEAIDEYLKKRERKEAS